MAYPSVSFVIPTYNVEDILVDCLESVMKQDYPKEKIEIVVVDGGSMDKTLHIAELYNTTIIRERTGRPEAATAIGYKNAKGDLIVNLPADNVIPTTSWLRQMVEPFIRGDSIVAAQTLRYTYCKTLGLLDRYFALFGVNDPLAYYLNKRDRISWIEGDYIPFGISKDMGDFFLVRIGSNEIPTLGANGYIVRREIILLFIYDVLDFFHIDSNVDMIRRGYDRYAIVKNTIVHRSGESLSRYFRKRIRYSSMYFRDKPRRRYHLYESSHDRRKLLEFILFSITLFKTTNDAVKGYKKIKDVAWYLNPVICFGITLCYAFTVMSSLFRIGERSNCGMTGEVSAGR